VTEAEARALPIGAPISDYGPGVGVVTEKHLDSLVIQWSAPPTRVEGVSTFMYDELGRWPAPVAGNAIFYPGDPTGPPNSMGNTPLVLGASFLSSVAASLTKVHFYKDVADADVSHVATVWRASDQVKLGQATFPAGPPTGWQSVAIGPIAMTLGVVYVATVTHPGSNYEFFWPFVADVTSGILTLSKIARYQASSDPNVFPTNTIDGYYYGIDVTVG